MFNLSKYADFEQMFMDGAESVEDSINSPESTDNSQEEAAGSIIERGPDADVKTRVLQLQQDQELLKILENFSSQYPAEVEAIKANQDDFSKLRKELLSLTGLTEQHNMGALTSQVPSFAEFKEKSGYILDKLQRLKRTRIEHARNQIPLGVAAFNLRQYKEAQMPQQVPMQQSTPQATPQPTPQGMPQAMPQAMPEEQTKRFPVKNEGDFIDKFADDLLRFDSNPGTPEYERGRRAAEEIRAAVSPGFEEEADSVLESIMQLDNTQRNTASKYLIKLYEVMIPPALTGDQAESQMEPVMSEKNQDAIEGIVRFSLTESILNNNKDVMTKTAADQFGQQYLLYGPTEKRICPKLRGKNLSVGDVVSEYTCRHHCLDGIVIDDNKTVCGEALWRANAMDKFSREYVDEDGNTVGGYINKRFEVNRNVPEENKMRLKPGETRKPRPAAWGNTESRLQDMRAKEGQARGYRPEINTGEPFKWCHDVDQNNVEVSQKERDRREETAGHKTVQYTNRDQGENNPKKANQKTAQKNTSCNCGKEECPKCRGENDTPCDCGKEECPRCQGWKYTLRVTPGRSSEKENTKRQGSAFNLKQFKTAKFPPDSPRDNHQTAVNPAAAGAFPPSDIQSIKGRQGIDSGKPMSSPPKAMSIEDMETEKYDFAAGEAKVRSMSDEALLHTLKDLNETIDIQESSSKTGASTPKLGYYHDERHTIGEEIQRRGGLAKLRAKVEQGRQQHDREFPAPNPQGDGLDNPEPRTSGFNLSQFKKEAKGKRSKKEKGVTYEGEHFDSNPWAICNKSTGGKNKAGEEKFESCVQSVKDQDREKDNGSKKKK